MSTAGYDPAVVHNYDLVSILYGADTLRNDDLCGLRYICPEGVLDDGVCLCIYSTGGIIQDKYLGFFQQSPGDSEPLLLSAGNIGPALLDIGIILVRELLYKLVCAGKPCSLTYLLIRGMLIAPAQVFRDRAGE